MLYLRYIADLYKVREMRVDLVYDYICDELIHTLKDINANRPEVEGLVVEFIDPCLTMRFAIRIDTTLWFHDDFQDFEASDLEQLNLIFWSASKGGFHFIVHSCNFQKVQGIHGRGSSAQKKTFPTT